MKEELIRNLKYLLQRLDIVRDKISARNENKETFNVFSCLLNERDEENLHSRFISCLIDPHGNHGLGFNPIKHLLEILGSSFMYEKDSIEVFPSFADRGEYKEIDILMIDRKQRHAIIIENKIDASDSNHQDEGQLERYYRRIIEEDHIPQENVEVYYLTIDGHEPSEASTSTSKRYKDLPDIIRCITYDNEMLTWLRLCMQDACDKPYIRETLAQYINLIKKMTNNTEIEDRLEIIKIISRNNETLASAKLLFDNYKHIQWHTVFDFFNDFYTELGNRGYTCTSKVENTMIDHIVHGGPIKRQQCPSFDIKDKYGIETTIGCDYNHYFHFGLQSKTNNNIDRKAVSQFLHADKEYDSICHIENGWIFWLYFDCPNEFAINIWDFSQNGTFRIINPNTRRETIKKYLDYLEDFIYNKIKIQEFLH